jgi:sulfite reductase beta subunit-like hemoprotein
VERPLSKQQAAANHMVADLVLVPLRLLLDEDAGDRYYVGGAVGALRPGVEALAAHLVGAGALVTIAPTLCAACLPPECLP